MIGIEEGFQRRKKERSMTQSIIDLKEFFFLAVFFSACCMESLHVQLGMKGQHGRRRDCSWWGSKTGVRGKGKIKRGSGVGRAFVLTSEPVLQERKCILRGLNVCVC